MELQVYTPEQKDIEVSLEDLFVGHEAELKEIDRLYELSTELEEIKNACMVGSDSKAIKAMCDQVKEKYGQDNFNLVVGQDSVNKVFEIMVGAESDNIIVKIVKAIVKFFKNIWKKIKQFFKDLWEVFRDNDKVIKAKEKEVNDLIENFENDIKDAIHNEEVSIEELDKLTSDQAAFNLSIKAGSEFRMIVKQSIHTNYEDLFKFINHQLSHFARMGGFTEKPENPFKLYNDWLLSSFQGFAGTIGVYNQTFPDLEWFQTNLENLNADTDINNLQLMLPINDFTATIENYLNTVSPETLRNVYGRERATSDDAKAIVKMIEKAIKGATKYDFVMMSPLAISGGILFTVTLILDLEDKGKKGGAILSSRTVSIAIGAFGPAISVINHLTDVHKKDISLAQYSHKTVYRPFEYHQFDLANAVKENLTYLNSGIIVAEVKKLLNDSIDMDEISERLGKDKDALLNTRRKIDLWRIYTAHAAHFKKNAGKLLKALADDKSRLYNDFLNTAEADIRQTIKDIAAYYQGKRIPEMFDGEQLEPTEISLRIKGSRVTGSVNKKEEDDK